MTKIKELEKLERELGMKPEESPILDFVIMIACGVYVVLISTLCTLFIYGIVRIGVYFISLI